MPEYQTPSPHLPESAGVTGHPEIAETLSHNIRMLEGMPAVLGAQGAVLGTIEDRRCAVVPAILYVDRTTGRIEGIGSYEEIKRAKQWLPTPSETEVSVEQAATGLSAEMLSNPDISRIRVWHEYAAQFERIDENEVRALRPASWPRNSRVRISGSYLRDYPLEDLLPDPIERGLFLKSIEDFNGIPESDNFVG